MKHPITKTLFCILISLAAGTASATVSYDESVSGDVSNNPQSPTLINVALGTNSFVATMPGTDLDFITFNVPANAQLSGIIMAAYDSIDEISFIAVAPGSQLPASVLNDNPAGLSGYAHFGPSDFSIGSDILPAMSLPKFGVPGFATPLPSGNYSFWIQQEAFIDESYQLDFVVTATPEPSTLMLLSLGLGGTFTFRRGRR